MRGFSRVIYKQMWFNMNIFKATHTSKLGVDAQLVFQIVTDLLILVAESDCSNTNISTALKAMHIHVKVAFLV